MIPVEFDYVNLKKLAGLEESLEVKAPRNFDEEPRIGKGTVKDIYSFNITFGVNKPTFTVEQYGSDFQRALEEAAKYGGAEVHIVGHADPHTFVEEIVKSGVAQGIFKDAGNKTITYKGQNLDLKDIKNLFDIVAKENFPAEDKRDFPDGAKNMLKLSQDRAEAVRKAVMDYAASKKIVVDVTQLKFGGVGLEKPASIVYPPVDAERAKNRRVEFKIVALVPDAK
jgi:outer membrane protein OmpA-like peptidoglycan-associated protein